MAGNHPRSANANPGLRLSGPLRSIHLRGHHALLIMAEAWCPSATTQAPVSVATSISAMGLKPLAIGQRIAEYEAAFRIGVEHLNGFS